MVQKLLIPAVIVAVLQLIAEWFHLPIMQPFGAIVSAVGMACSLLTCMAARSRANDRNARIALLAFALYAVGLMIWLVAVTG